MFFIQTGQQRIHQAPIRAVIVHFDLLADDALLFGDGLCGKIRMGHHLQQHIQALLQLAGGGEQVAGAVKNRKGIGIGPCAGKLCKCVAILILEHLVLQKMSGARRQMDGPTIHHKILIDGAEMRSQDHMGGGIIRHRPGNDGQTGGQMLPLVCRNALQKRTAPQRFIHGPTPLPLSADS